MDAQHTYSRINEALNQLFFDGRFAGHPVYLSLDNEMREELASKIGCKESEVEDQVCAGVRGFLGISGDPYGPFNLDARAWAEAGMQEPPPFIGVLFSLSHAAALMAADGKFGANNYYVRLAQLTGVPRDTLSNYRASTENLWKGLAAWLLQNNYALGKPSARATNAWRYVGMAMSQAIVRASDRPHFHDMFEKFHFSGGETIDARDMEHYLSIWMATAGPTQHLKRVWKEEELRERVAESAVAELAVWNRRAGASPGGGLPKPLRMQLLANLVQGFPRHSLELHLGRVDDGGPRGPYSLRGSGGSFFLANETFGGIATVSPSLLQQDVGLASAVHLDPPSASKEPGLEWQPRLIVPFSMQAQANTWVEVQRVAFGVPSLVLVRDANNLPAHVERYFADACLQLPARATPGQLEGLPNGWVLYQGVQLRKLIKPLNDELACLAPLGDDGTLVVEGGLQLLPGFYHVRCAPTINFVAPSGPTRIEASGLDGAILSQVTGDGTECSIALQDIALARRDALEIVAWRGRARIATKEVFFRDASRPHPLNQDKRGQLSYASILSASQSASLKGLQLQGYSALGTLPGLESFGATMAASLHVGGREEGQKAVLAASLARHATSQTCIERGYHIYVFPQIKRKIPAGTPVEGTCSGCARSKFGISQGHGVKRHTQAPAVGRLEMPAIQVASTSKRVSIDHDLLLDALSFLGHGSWQRFISLVATWNGAEEHPRDVAHSLFLLGHLDLELRKGSNVVKAWSVPPASLNFTRERSAFLSGFRSTSLLDDIAAGTRGAGGEFIVDMIEGRPSLVTIEGMTEAGAIDALSGIRDPLGRTLTINSDVAANVARACAGLAGFEASLTPASVGRSRNLQKFSLASMQWENVPTVLSSGAYRWNEGLQNYAYVDATGQAVSTAYRVAKLLAARERRVRLHHYDDVNTTFIAILGCEPPGLLERALVACSGLLPTKDGNFSNYTDVPAHIASAVFNKLYSESHFANE